ncbi:hypothetical protein JAAARDRAFT_639331 [Jaapia argillacea MUCL 33604]|uniref:Uncharacterized protein n=1 Tax=Jaapia argillacea MUCL 33604 TaxID=933084 RepID=A0A067P484_9AGAM|nr:hypothetical protein JAAARDRAFT_639331 [Jaapia argillacea MUCL 33604]
MLVGSTFKPGAVSALLRCIDAQLDNQSYIYHETDRGYSFDRDQTKLASHPPLPDSGTLIAPLFACAEPHTAVLRRCIDHSSPSDQQHALLLFPYLRWTATDQLSTMLSQINPPHHPPAISPDSHTRPFPL